MASKLAAARNAAKKKYDETGSMEDLAAYEDAKDAYRESLKKSKGKPKADSKKTKGKPKAKPKLPAKAKSKLPAEKVHTGEYEKAKKPVGNSRRRKGKVYEAKKKAASKPKQLEKAKSKLPAEKVHTGEYEKAKKPVGKSRRRKGKVYDARKKAAKAKAVSATKKLDATKKKAFGAGSTAAQRNQSRLAMPKSGATVKKVAGKKAASNVAIKVAGKVAARAVPLVGAALTMKDVYDYGKKNRENIEKSNARQRPKADQSLKSVKSSTGNKSGARKLYEERMAKRKAERDKKRKTKKPTPVTPKKQDKKTPTNNKSSSPQKQKKSTLAIKGKSTGASTRKARSASKQRQLDKKLPAAANLRKQFNELNAYKGTFQDFKREHFKKKGYK